MGVPEPLLSRLLSQLSRPDRLSVVHYHGEENMAGQLTDAVNDYLKSSYKKHVAMELIGYGQVALCNTNAELDLTDEKDGLDWSVSHDRAWVLQETAPPLPSPLGFLLGLSGRNTITEPVKLILEESQLFTSESVDLVWCRLATYQLADGTLLPAPAKVALMQLEELDEAEVIYSHSQQLHDLLHARPRAPYQIIVQAPTPVALLTTFSQLKDWDGMLFQILDSNDDFDRWDYLESTESSHVNFDAYSFMSMLRTIFLQQLAEQDLLSDQECRIFTADHAFAQADWACAKHKELRYLPELHETMSAMAAEYLPPDKCNEVLELIEQLPKIWDRLETAKIILEAHCRLKEELTL